MHFREVDQFVCLQHSSQFLHGRDNISTAAFAWISEHQIITENIFVKASALTEM